MRTKIISKTGFILSEIGLGCMGMSEFYGSTNEQESISTIELAIEKGITHFDTADNYGYGENEKLLGKALTPYRDKVTIATKFGIIRDKNDPTARGVDGSPQHAIEVCNQSLKSLQTDYIDLFYLHRMDFKTPIEDTIYAMSKLVQEGKVRYLGLSEADCESIKRANAVHPITAIQSEYSLWSRGVEIDILPLCKELGIGFIPYSPLGRGFLTGAINSIESLEDSDFRKTLPRFQNSNIEHNLLIITKLKEISAKKNCTVAQLALAWVMAKESFIVPIFGTKRTKYLLENIGAAQIKFSQQEMDELELIASINFPRGSRYSESAMKIYGFKD